MTSSLSRATLSGWLLIALAAACARNTGQDPDRSTIEPIESVFRVTAPGLSVTRTPSGGIAIQLLGGPSSFYSSNAPLYLVDDEPFQPGPGGVLTGINPHDIESIKLLKDPAETGLYGMRGANGVIVIKLKKLGKSSG
jgi:TonB-dependent SusC/RagA subfamily outer membrane receptor